MKKGRLSMEMDHERYVFINSSIGKSTTFVMILAGVHDSLDDPILAPSAHFSISVEVRWWHKRCGSHSCISPLADFFPIGILALLWMSRTLHGRWHITAHGLYRQQGGGQAHVGLYPGPYAPQRRHGVGQ
jgi:hypothetical protein